MLFTNRAFDLFDDMFNDPFFTRTYEPKTITANHEENKDENYKNGKFIRKERYTGTCKRSFYVGEQVRQEDIKAAFQNGILRLAIPKQLPQVEKEQPKLITIE